MKGCQIMTVIVNETDATSDALAGQRVAVVGYGNQGRSWALNLRDSGLDVAVYARADPSRETAQADGFDAGRSRRRERRRRDLPARPRRRDPHSPARASS